MVRSVVGLLAVGFVILSLPLTTRWSALNALAVTGGAPGAEDLPTAVPEDVGMSTERLARIGEVVDRAIEAEFVTGAVTLVMREGK
ncbi:uncharacterized protein METZ01_LOCUS396502, partial [marine metagenome]